MNRLVVLMIFFDVFLSCGCGVSTPSDRQARQVFDAAYQGMTQLGANIVDFRKQNAEMKELEGQKIYEYHFLAAAELPTGLAWQGQGFLSGGGFLKDPGPAARQAASRGLFGGVQITPLPKGTTAVSKGTITFRMTEEGWIPNPVVHGGVDAYCFGMGPKACYKQLGWDKLN